MPLSYRDDLLLALIVRSKRKRSNDGTPIYQSIHPKVSKKSEVEKTAAAIVNLDKNPTYNPTPVGKYLSCLKNIGTIQTIKQENAIEFW